MKKGETIYSMTDHTFAKEYAAFLEEINKTRGKLGVKLNLVYSYENWNQKSRHNLRKKRRLFDPKVLPEGFKIPSRIIVYKDTTVISVFAKEPIITVIRNKDFSYSQKQYIKMLWKIAKTPEGYEDSYNQ